MLVLMEANDSHKEQPLDVGCWDERFEGSGGLPGVQVKCMNGKWYSAAQDVPGLDDLSCRSACRWVSCRSADTTSSTSRSCTTSSLSRGTSWR